MIALNERERDDTRITNYICRRLTKWQTGVKVANVHMLPTKLLYKLSLENSPRRVNHLNLHRLQQNVWKRVEHKTFKCDWTTNTVQLCNNTQGSGAMLHMCCKNICSGNTQNEQWQIPKSIQLERTFNGASMSTTGMPLIQYDLSFAKCTGASSIITEFRKRS